ncbi:MAG: zinc ribbon domain-containing protein [Candidatus Thorarchaeota archaeon]
MSDFDLEIKWVEFVKKLRTIGALLLFVFIPYLAFVIIPIQFILTIIAIKDLKNMNRELNNSFLYNFHSKYLTATIVKFIGSILLHLAAAMIAAVITIGPIFDPFFVLPFPGLPPAITLVIIGFIIMIIGSSVEVGAWDNLKFFIQDKKDMFPARNLNDTLTSIENLRTGAFLWALGFLIIPIVIGWIFQLIGYFGLSRVAKWGMKLEPITPIKQEYTPISQIPQEHQPVTTITQDLETVDVIQFCPMCGAKVTEGAKYCGECGVNLKS